MILYAVFQAFIFLLGFIGQLMNTIPAINSINQAIEPYIQALSDLLTSGIELISFFVPLQLLRVFIPIVIIIELLLENLDIIKFALKKVLGR